MTTTAMSQRVRITRLGWDTPLSVESAEPPTPARDQVLLKVEACGVCYRDCIDRSGLFKFIRVPITPGHEVAGRVVAVGPDVTEWRVGDRVGSMHREFCGACAACGEGQASLCTRTGWMLGLVADGGYASHMLAPQRALYALPQDLPAATAAVLHCTFGTAYRGLRRLGRLQAGHRVVITGANGGVGVAAVQLAARLGAEVVAVARDESHRSFLTELGASVVIADRGDGFHKRLPGPADVAMDCVGEPTFNAAMRSLRPGGRLISIGNVVPERVEVNLGYVITRGIQILGSTGATREDMAEVLALHAERALNVAIHAELPLARAEDAQRQVRAGGLRGRIVLIPDGARGATVDRSRSTQYSAGKQSHSEVKEP